MQSIDVNDLESLTELVSEEYGPWSESLTVNQAMINTYAELTGDNQWIHIDEERAKKESPFGATIAHGFLTLSLMAKVRPKPLFIVKNYKSVTNYGSSGLRFLAPVICGDRIRSKQRLVEVTEHRLGCLLTSEVLICIEGKEKPALQYNLQLLYLK